MRYTDARERTIELDAPPRRIVSLVPSQTELLADLGLDAEVVGLTRFCVHPEGWKEAKRIVGGTKNVSVERVAALRPDLVIANLEENVREQVETIDTFAPAFVTDVHDVPSALAMIRTVGALVGRTGEADAIAAEIDEGFFAISRDLAGLDPLRIAYFIWRDPWMTVGGDTFIHDVLRRAGLHNVFGDRTRYPEVTPEEVAEARPDVVLLSSEPFPFGKKHIAEVEALLTGAAVRLVDGELFSWYGSRLRRTPPYLAHLRPELADATAA